MLKKMDRHASRAIAVGTREIDPRVLVQQGAFTIHADAADLADVAYGSFRTWRVHFRIPNGAKDKIKQTLFQLAITKSSLFPDLGALAEELKSISFA